MQKVMKHIAVIYKSRQADVLNGIYWVMYFRILTAIANSKQWTEHTIEGKWDILIAHPPCTHLAVSGARWFKEGVKPLYLQEEAADFFMKFINADCDKICVENPVCIMSTRYKKPSQIINPYQFGHPEQKKTCLWLKGLPVLKDTNNVKEYMMTLPLKERTRIHWLGSGKSKERSKTFPGIAQAMADQWG